jgi:hypothetical protein
VLSKQLVCSPVHGKQHWRAMYNISPTHEKHQIIDCEFGLLCFLMSPSFGNLLEQRSFLGYFNTILGPVLYFREGGNGLVGKSSFTALSEGLREIHQYLVRLVYVSVRHIVCT